MKNNEISTIDELIQNPNSFDFELVKSLILKRGTPLVKEDGIKLLNIVESMYFEIFENFKEKNSIYYLESEYNTIVTKLWNYGTLDYSDYDSKVKDSLFLFFQNSSNLIKRLFEQKVNKFKNGSFNPPPTSINTLSQEETALLFLTLRKQKIIHPDVSNKDLATLINGLTGYASVAMTGTLSKMYKEKLKLNPSIAEKLIEELNHLISILKKEIANK